MQPLPLRLLAKLKEAAAQQEPGRDHHRGAWLPQRRIRRGYDRAGLVLLVEHSRRQLAHLLHELWLRPYALPVAPEPHQAAARHARPLHGDVLASRERAAGTAAAGGERDDGAVRAPGPALAHALGHARHVQPCGSARLLRLRQCDEVSHRRRLVLAGFLRWLARGLLLHPREQLGSGSYVRPDGGQGDSRRLRPRLGGQPPHVRPAAQQLRRDAEVRRVDVVGGYLRKCSRSLCVFFRRSSKTRLHRGAGGRSVGRWRAASTISSPAIRCGRWTPEATFMPPTS